MYNYKINVGRDKDKSPSVLSIKERPNFNQFNSNQISILEDEINIYTPTYQVRPVLESQRPSVTVSNLMKLKLKKKLLGQDQMIKDWREIERMNSKNHYGDYVSTSLNSRNLILPQAYSTGMKINNNSGFTVGVATTTQYSSKSTRKNFLISSPRSNTKRKLQAKRQSEVCRSVQRFGEDDLRYLIEEHSMFKQETEEKIKIIIDNASQENNDQFVEEQQLKSEIERIASISEQTRFEMLFNHDLAYSYDCIPHCNKEQNRKVLENQKLVLMNLINKTKSDYESENFDSQAFEIAKTMRLMLRDVTNKPFSQLFSILFVWMMKWLDTMLRNSKQKIAGIEEKTVRSTKEVKQAIENRWEILELGVKSQVDSREQKIKELQQSLARLIEDKRQVEDALRSRDEEMQLLLRNTDYSQINILLGELKQSLDLAEVQSSERDPYIQKIKDMVKMLREGDTLKKKHIQQQALLETKKKTFLISKLKMKDGKVIIEAEKPVEEVIMMRGTQQAKNDVNNVKEEGQEESDAETKIQTPFDGQIPQEDGKVKCPQCNHEFQINSSIFQKLNDQSIEESVQANITDHDEDKYKEAVCQTQLCLLKEPYASLVNQLYELSKCRATVINNRKVLVLPKERTEISDLSFKGIKDLSMSQSYGTKQSDASVLKVVEVAMEEMVKLEIQDKQQMKKMYDFREYLLEHLLNQYGLRNIAQKNYELVNQRLTEQAGNEFNRYSILLLNIMGQQLEDEQEEFSMNKQHVLIFAKIIFSDSQNVSKPGPARGDISPSRKKITADNNGQAASLFATGGDVSVFELCEAMSKNLSNAILDMRMIENIQPSKPDEIDLEDSELSQQSFEIDLLEFAKMKITAKIAKFGFDHKYFVETLDYQASGKLQFQEFLDAIQTRFQIFLSVQEKEALGKQISQHTLNSSQSSPPRQQMINLYSGSRPLGQFTFTQQEYTQRLRNYTINKTDFMQYVLKQWEEYMIELGIEIEKSFKRYDTLFNRGGINFQQFQSLIKNENKISSFIQEGENLEKLFYDALQFLEENDDLRRQQFLGIAALKEILLERNLESLPFYTYMKHKYGVSGGQGGRSKNYDKHSPDTSLQNKGRIVLKRI